MAAGQSGRGGPAVEVPPAGRGTDAPRLAHDQNRMYSRLGSPSGRRRPVVGWRIQPVGSRSMPTWSLINAATAALSEAYHQWSSTRIGFCALRSRRRPRPNRRAVTSHVGLPAGSRRAGRARAGHEPFLELAHPVRRREVAMTVGMLLVRRLRLVVDSPLPEAPALPCMQCSLSCLRGRIARNGAPVSPLRSPLRGRGPSGQPPFRTR